MSNTFLKSLIPPILLIKILKLRSYIKFLKFKEFISINDNLKDIHKGKRCFILGSGPSIKKENLLVLKDEIVLALNNFYVHEDFAEIMSGDLPKYYMTAPIHLPQTENEWKRWFCDMESKMPKQVNMLFGLSAYKGNIKYIFDKYEIFKKQKINWYFAGIDANDYFAADPKDLDISKMIWKASTCSVYAIIAAIYMGFSEIYLLGMDHNQPFLNKKEMRFYKKAIHQKDEIKRVLNNKSFNKHSFEALSNIFAQYEILNKSKSKIINLTQGGTVDIFDRNTLESIHKNNNL